MNTINTLQYLTEEIKTIFCHSTLVDRVAAMLNYFLLHLVGPKKKNFKVFETVFIRVIVLVRNFQFKILNLDYLRRHFIYF